MWMWMRKRVGSSSSVARWTPVWTAAGATGSTLCLLASAASKLHFARASTAPIARRGAKLGPERYTHDCMEHSVRLSTLDDTSLPACSNCAEEGCSSHGLLCSAQFGPAFSRMADAGGLSGRDETAVLSMGEARPLGFGTSSRSPNGQPPIRCCSAAVDHALQQTGTLWPGCHCGSGQEADHITLGLGLVRRCRHPVTVVHAHGHHLTLQ